jgi:hypothetical protein
LEWRLPQRADTAVAKATKGANNMALFGLSALFGRSKLSSLESQVLAAVSAELSPAGREVLSKQIGLVNLIQRHGDGKEVNLYVMRRGKPCFEDRFLFPSRAAETQLANVEIVGGSGQESLKAEVWLVEGWVFSIHFNKPPRKIVGPGANAAKAKILHDPMIPASQENASKTENHEPVLAGVQSKLPEEYLRTVQKGTSVLLNQWAVYAIPDIRKVPQRDGNYFLLAEKGDMGAVGVKEDDFSGQLYYLDYGDDRGEKITVGFRKFLEEFDGGKVVGRF